MVKQSQKLSRKTWCHVYNSYEKCPVLNLLVSSEKQKFTKKNCCKFRLEEWFLRLHFIELVNEKKMQKKTADCEKSPPQFQLSAALRQKPITIFFDFQIQKSQKPCYSNSHKRNSVVS